MTTDITELAQREKFEAWWEREYKHLESSKYTDAVPHVKYGFWMAFQAGGAELVEALEKAQQERDNWRTSFDNERFRADKLKAHIDDIEPIRAAAEKLVRCKGRYHSELNYRALADLFGVTMPDLPPLDGESRTVKLPDEVDVLLNHLEDVLPFEVFQLIDVNKWNAVSRLSAAGIKWEAE